MEAAPKSWFASLSPVNCPHFWLGYTEERLGKGMWGLQGEGWNYKVCIHALARQGVRLMLHGYLGRFFLPGICVCLLWRRVGPRGALPLSASPFSLRLHSKSLTKVREQVLLSPVSLSPNRVSLSEGGKEMSHKYHC